jgi:hypothetical protein
VTGLARPAARRQTEGIHAGGRVMKLWRIALAAWLILYGLLALTNLQVQASGLIMGVTAVAAAVLLLFDR